MKGLTRRQSEIFQFIRTYTSAHTCSPSYREIMDHFGLSSIGTIHKHIACLIRKGALTNEKRCARSLSVVNSVEEELQTREAKKGVTRGTTSLVNNLNSQVKNNQTKRQDSQSVWIPFMGNVSVESSIETFPQISTIAVPAIFVPNPEKSYILQVRSDSFADEHILDQDLLIVEARPVVQPGELILGLVNQHNVLIKRCYPEGQYVRLESSHGRVQPMTIDSQTLAIQGAVVGLMRLF